MEPTGVESTPTGTAFPEGPKLRGRLTLARHYKMALHWHPHYIEDLPRAIKGIPLTWQRFVFQQKNKKLIPNETGVYCFAAAIGPSFPKDLNIPLYIGMASPGTLRERFLQYLDRQSSTVERKKIADMLQQYKGRLEFWCATVTKWGLVHLIENHLLWACFPPCNTQHHVARREKCWGTAW